jgi:hypothetical protein
MTATATPSATEFSSAEDRAAWRLQTVLGGKVLSFAEIDRPEPIEGILHSGITAITGQPFDGKTTVALSMMRALLDDSEKWATGAINFDQGQKIAFYGENPRGLARAHTLKEEFPGRVVLLQTLILNTDAQAEMAEVIKEENIGLFFIDSAYRAAGDLSSPEVATRFTNALSAFGRPVGVLHHSPRPVAHQRYPKRPSGSQAWDAAYEQVVHVNGGGRSGRKTLTIWGNNVPEEWQLGITVDYASLQASINIDPTSSTQASKEDGPTQAGRRPRAKRSQLTAAEQVVVLAQLAHAAGIDREADHNAIGLQLLGGRQGNEDPGKQKAVGDAIGVDKPMFRTTTEKLKKEHVAYMQERSRLAQG